MSQIVNPQDTVIAKLKCKWAELHSTINGRERYLVYLLVKGKKYHYEIVFSGFLRNREGDLLILQEIMSSYREKRK